MSATSAYLDGLSAAIARLRDQPLRRCSEVVASAMKSDGMVFIFGSGHSQLVAMEACTRAGGLAGVVPLVDLGLSPMLPDRAGATERLPGYAQVALAQWDIRLGDVVIVVSNSGINAVPVELAQSLRRSGIPVIAVTSSANYRSAPSRALDHSRLADCADIVVDTGVPYGDVSIEVQGRSTGPTSGAVATAVIHAIMAGAVENLLSHGVEPALISSQNVPGGDERNAPVRKSVPARHGLR